MLSEYHFDSHPGLISPPILSHGSLIDLLQSVLSESV